MEHIKKLMFFSAMSIETLAEIDEVWLSRYEKMESERDLYKKLHFESISNHTGKKTDEGRCDLVGRGWSYNKNALPICGANRHRGHAPHTQKALKISK
jgi:hypothetical protein